MAVPRRGVAIIADWIPIETDFIITGKVAEELAARPDPGMWLKAYIQKKCNLPHTAEIDLSGIKIAPAKKSSEEHRKG